MGAPVINMQGPSKEMAYDLRQIYANLLGEHLVDAAIARKANNFYGWLKALEDIETIGHHLFQNKDDADKKFKEIKDEISKLANQHEQTWLGNNTTDAAEMEAIDAALRKMEKFLYDELEKGNTFGKGMGERHF